MTVIEKLASSMGRADEEPNIALARETARTDDTAAVKELVGGLRDRNKDVQSDSVKVLYEIAALKPDLIDDHVKDFVDLLGSKNNRLVWGGMTALGSIADRKADDVWKHVDAVIKATQTGSVITQDWGVRVLAAVASKNEKYRARLFPMLVAFLTACPPKDLPRHLESVRIAIDRTNRGTVEEIIERRRAVLTPAQAKRVDAVLKTIK